MKKIFLYKKISFILLIFVFFGGSSNTAQAVIFNFEKILPQIHVGDTFEIIITLNPEDININAIEGMINISPSLKTISISEQGSFISLWIDSPNVIENKISFSAIMPGGYNGNRGVSWQGVKPGKVFTMYLKATDPGIAYVELQNQKVLQNDGKGTSLPVAPAKIQFEVLPANPSEIGITITSDTIPPEPFTATLAKDETLFDNQYFVVAHTEDKDTGIDHYEYAESASNSKNNAFLKWKKVEGPYLLSDQSLKSYIYVKAVDRAGNEQIFIILPENSKNWLEKNILSIVVLGIIILFINYLLIQRIKHIHKKVS